MPLQKGHIIFILFIFCYSCTKTDDDTDTYVPTPALLEVPQLFENNIIPPIQPNNNMLTEEGIALGKRLFFDPILSKDNTIACANCHTVEHAFSDNKPFSNGVNGNLGIRNAMPLFNLAWNYSERFLWDGSVFSLEQQVSGPITNPIEMNSSWDVVLQKLKQDSEYPELFRRAFNTTTIDTIIVAKALAQFERSLISSNSKFDQFLLGEATLTPQEQNGFDVFMDETRGDCFHCHGSDKNPLWTDNAFHNNGLDTTFKDLGLGAVTGDPADNGKFRSPSLRNLAFTAPYMHDGRFNTLEEVIDHYSEGLKQSSTIDPLMKKVALGGVGLSTSDKADLKAFLLTLSDVTFVSNPKTSN